MLKRRGNGAGGGKGSNQYQQKPGGNLDTQAPRHQAGGIAQALGQGDPDPWNGFNQDQHSTTWSAGMSADEARDYLKATSGWDKPEFSATTLWRNHVPVEDVPWFDRGGLRDPGSVSSFSKSGVSGQQFCAFQRSGYTQLETQARLARAGVTGDADSQFCVTYYRQVGIKDAEEMAGYAERGINPYLAAHYRRGGVTDPETVSQLNQRGLEALDATTYYKAGISSPADMEHLARNGVTSVDAVAARQCGATSMNDMIRTVNAARSRRARRGRI